LNIYVGNLSFDTSERDLEAAFAIYGAVTSARIATDRDTNRPRGFGFVEMGNQTEAEAAIAGLNGTDLQGRTLTVNEARPREDRGGGGGGGRRGGGGYGGGGGGYGGGGGGGGGNRRW
jgi:RNA recognition motif-containing protein